MTQCQADVNAIPCLRDLAAGPSWETSLNAIQSEVRKRLKAPGPSADWLHKLGEAFLELDSARAAPQQIDILILLTEWYEDNLDRRFVLRILEHALEITSKAGALASKRRVLNALGSVHNRMRNIADATVCYARALQLAEEIGDRVGRCAVLANIAVLRLNMGMIDDATKVADFVIELCGNETVLSPLKAQAHHALAEAYLLLSDPSAACQQTEKALRILTEPGNRLDSTKRVLMESTLVKGFVSQGKVREAEQHTTTAMRYSAKAGTFTATIQAQLCLAACDAAKGNADIALTRLASLESELPKTDASFRDLLQVELFANSKAGRKRYASYYNKKYLSLIAEFQRKSAIDQIAAVKRSLKQVDMTGRDVNDGSRQNRETRALAEFSQHINSLAALAELREDATGEHSCRVGRLAASFARSLGYSENDAATIEMAARLHDVGKLATPDAILLKRGKLSVAEREIVQRHSNEGCQILTDLLYTLEATDIRNTTKWAEGLRVAAEVAQCHHEFWNGRGYPRGISGKLIPECARIVAVVDVYDELTHRRPYKRQYTKAASARQIESLAGTQLDARFCVEFLRIIDSVEDVQPPEESTLTPFLAANRVIKRLVNGQTDGLSRNAPRAEL
jgi:HD-GYP domain-containing protein (c-di-GMP phosphodiesterase class II)